ncbi:SDR family oxidoreductase [Nocardioides gilvus]|uniref:SDR family oxidoreductase n=1 Tax=Nocardioides gilvus TaxID=1735589 RepID=UPI000D74C68C|nr:SDR family oxidoreductase [Nocardioides gilvus]
MTRTHVVTGAGSGIGRALAARLADRGDRLVLPVRSAERAAQVQAEFGPEHLVVVLDLADPDACASGLAALVDSLTSAGWSVDSLVHSAGVVDLADVADFDQATWGAQIQVNLTAPAALTGALLPFLRRARGSVVFVNSTSGLVANPTWGAYAASKHGLRGLADSLRAEEARHGVRVTSVFPSRTATEMQAKVHAQEERDYHAEVWMRPESVAASLLHVLDLPVDATITELTIRTSPSPS